MPILPSPRIRRALCRAPLATFSLLVPVVLALLLAGCVTIGGDFHHASVGLIKPGQTGDKEVLKLFGNPLRTGVNDAGLREWSYAHYSASAFGKFEGRDLVVTFEHDGTVKSFSYHTTDPTEAIVQPK